MTYLFAIPNKAENAREWILWIAEILAALGVIIAAGRKLTRMVAKATHDNLVDMFKPELDQINARVGEMSASNEAQHGEVARTLGALRADFNAHMAEADESRAALTMLMENAELNMTALRKDLSEPGLPVTSSPPSKPRYRF